MKPLSSPRAALWVIVAVALAGCSAPEVQRSQAACSPADEVVFPLAPSGAPEARPDWLWTHRCQVDIVDVREADEVEGGVIPGAVHVPLGKVEAFAADLDPAAPIVFVCRSGRRSARAVALVERQGFSRAASLTGGMLAWEHKGLPTTRRARHGQETPKPRADADLPLADALAQAHIPRVRAASLLMGGFESCVDGRDGHPVIGTPGGDVGELVLALSTVEALTQVELDAEAVNGLFEAYVGGFGRVYLHTDSEALQTLSRKIPDAPDNLDQVERWLRAPPLEHRERLLALLVEPEQIGCGHLRLVRSHPEAYGVRPGLVDLIIAAYFRTLWSQPENVEFVVLDGGHREGGVIVVEPEREVHPFTNVPAVAPILAGRAYFVSHPGATAFIRSQYVDFMLERIEQLESHGVDRKTLEAALNERGALQSEQTLSRLGDGLPRYSVDLENDEPVVKTIEVQ